MVARAFDYRKQFSKLDVEGTKLYVKYLYILILNLITTFETCNKTSSCYGEYQYFVI